MWDDGVIGDFLEIPSVFLTLESGLSHQFCVIVVADSLDFRDDLCSRDRMHGWWLSPGKKTMVSTEPLEDQRIWDVDRCRGLRSR